MKYALGILVAFVAVVILVGLVIAGSVMGRYNEMVRLEQTTSEKWAQVQNVYQRRSDLIPNLVHTVQGYAAHERGTLAAVINARAKATQVQINPGDITPEKLAMFQQAQGELSGALSRLLVTVERYPELKANTLFQDLMTQLEGTENRIAVERKEYNEAIQIYNTTLKTFPNTIVAGFFGFKEKPFFHAEEKAQKVPVVEFPPYPGGK